MMVSADALLAWLAGCWRRRQPDRSRDSVAVKPRSATAGSVLAGAQKLRIAACSGARVANEYHSAVTAATSASPVW